MFIIKLFLENCFQKYSQTCIYFYKLVFYFEVINNLKERGWECLYKLINFDIIL